MLRQPAPSIARMPKASVLRQPTPNVAPRESEKTKSRQQVEKEVEKEHSAVEKEIGKESNLCAGGHRRHGNGLNGFSPHGVQLCDPSAEASRSVQTCPGFSAGKAACSAARANVVGHRLWVFFVQSKATGQLLGRARLLNCFELSADTFWSVWLLMWKEVESARNADSVKSGCALQTTFPA